MGDIEQLRDRLEAANNPAYAELLNVVREKCAGFRNGTHLHTWHDVRHQTCMYCGQHGTGECLSPTCCNNTGYVTRTIWAELGDGPLYGKLLAVWSGMEDTVEDWHVPMHQLRSLAWNAAPNDPALDAVLEAVK